MNEGPSYIETNKYKIVGAGAGAETKTVMLKTFTFTHQVDNFRERTE
jgi:hypothetical protein